MQFRKAAFSLTAIELLIAITATFFESKRLSATDPEVQGLEDLECTIAGLSGARPCTRASSKLVRATPYFTGQLWLFEMRSTVLNKQAPAPQRSGLKYLYWTILLPCALLTGTYYCKVLHLESSVTVLAESEGKSPLAKHPH